MHAREAPGAASYSLAPHLGVAGHAWQVGHHGLRHLPEGCLRQACPAAAAELGHKGQVAQHSGVRGVVHPEGDAAEGSRAVLWNVSLLSAAHRHLPVPGAMQVCPGAQVRSSPALHRAPPTPHPHLVYCTLHMVLRGTNQNSCTPSHGLSSCQ